MLVAGVIGSPPMKLNKGEVQRRDKVLVFVENEASPVDMKVELHGSGSSESLVCLKTGSGCVIDHIQGDELEACFEMEGAGLSIRR